MSSNLMDTSPGGENTQYESIKTVTEEPKKGNGQLSTPDGTETKGTTSDRGAEKAENMRYGQAMSEEGVGGFTAPSRNGGGVGGGTDEYVGQSRSQQGYTAETEMDTTVGG